MYKLYCNGAYWSPLCNFSKHFQFRTVLANFNFYVLFNNYWYYWREKARTWEEGTLHTAVDTLLLLSLPLLCRKDKLTMNLATLCTVPVKCLEIFRWWSLDTSIQKKGLANTLVAALVMATFCCSSPHIWIVKCIHIVDTFTEVNFKDLLVAKYVCM